MFARRTATRIKKGTVQKKNRYTKTPNYWNTSQDEIQVDIENPGKRYKHFLKKRDIKLFLEILPNREEIDVKFDAVLLASGSYSTDGWYKNGVIGICAWKKEMTQEYALCYFNAHKSIFDKLGVKYAVKKDYAICYFTENQIKAYLLLHIFLHELGHHHDRLNTKSGRIARGEKYAEDYAFKYAEIIWNRYFEYFPY
ncbi:hypothetical protein JGH11_19095 [Dysgonomonas sp. Marseille-P4677]|uniref:hypothetical protein n=1 Tax=Dysgonomonas sp. Marseille-P4677 TaxID=2364790 RepID=UPI001912FBA2|nr:hypothetical protein [Dysgonomonas sp. Marseille-P4677]MBK5722979.1 hypothetical protein [Dysgonomonas sp. Marseille-P4677]